MDGSIIQYNTHLQQSLFKPETKFYGSIEDLESGILCARKETLERDETLEEKKNKAEELKASALVAGTALSAGVTAIVLPLVV